MRSDGVASTTVSDFVIWTKHIHGDAVITETILALDAGQILRLKIDGVAGVWRRMADGRDGRPTLGVRPIGAAADHWSRLYRERRKALVRIELEAEPASSIPIVPSPASEAERAAALESLLSAGGQGWRSDGPYGPRDELYDR